MGDRGRVCPEELGVWSTAVGVEGKPGELGGVVTLHGAVDGVFSAVADEPPAGRRREILAACERERLYTSSKLGFLAKPAGGSGSISGQLHCLSAEQNGS